MNIQAVQHILQDLGTTRNTREELYQHFHAHPELSMQEYATAQHIINLLNQSHIPNQRVGKTGVVAILTNGEGPTVAMRADIDGLPLQETSGKSYASTAQCLDENNKQTPVAHACGHDVHIVSLIGALQAFAQHRKDWNGTYIGIFQPAEETAQGAQHLIDSGIASLIPKPDVYLGQHVLAAIPAGYVGLREGAFLTTASSIRIRIFGKGSHGSMPELSVDPVVLASSIVMRLQTIVSRELAASNYAIVTVGAIHAGSKSNIIPQEAELLVNTRAYSQETQNQIHEAIERIVRAECTLARCPQDPTFTYYDHYPLTYNDHDSTLCVQRAFRQYFADHCTSVERQSASEDFSIIPDALGSSYVYWALGGFADMQHAPGNHNPAFAPDMQPTLDRGVEAAVVAASAWLCR